MYFDHFPCFYHGSEQASATEPLFLEPGMFYTETNGGTEIFFYFALREEMNIGNFRKISKEGGVV